MSDRLTLPAKLALTGPTLTTTVAVISFGAVISSFWQPGMHLASISGSVSAAQTLSCAAGTIWLSFICMGRYSQKSRRCSMAPSDETLEREAAVGEMDLPGGEAALVGGEIDGQRGDLLGLAEPAHRLAVDKSLTHRLDALAGLRRQRGDALLQRRALDGAGADRIAAHAL